MYGTDSVRLLWETDDAKEKEDDMGVDVVHRQYISQTWPAGIFSSKMLQLANGRSNVICRERPM
jgi:hypothetical protein